MRHSVAGLRPALFLLLAASLPAADSRLADAAMNGDRDTLQTLLKQKADVNAAQGDGTTALHWAAFRDDLDMVKLLLAAGADVKAATREGAITPLFMACTNGNAAIIDALLKAGADANSVNANGTSALMVAASSGSVDALRVLIERGADVKTKEAAHGQTALMFAAALNRDAAVRLLLARGAEINAATVSKSVDRVRFDQDGNIVEDRPAAGGGRGAPRPQTAAAQDKADEAADAAAAADAAKAALEAVKAEIDALGRALGFQSAQFSLSKTKARAGDVAARAPRRVGPEKTGGMTALLFAAREGHMETARTLIEGGADLNQMSADQFSPLVMAIANGHLTLAKYLLDKGADPNKVSISGLTALYAVIDVQWAPHAWFPQPTTEQEKVGYLDLMKDLIAHGANVNAQSSGGRMAVHYATERNTGPKTLALLVEAGADLLARDADGRTPLEIAKLNEKTRLVEWITKRVRTNRP